VGGTQVTPRRERAAHVTKQVAADGDPGIHVKGRKIVHEQNVSVIPGLALNGIRVDERKGEEGMDVALSLDIFRYDAVVQTVSAVGG
jgi:hypothetical protein